jgi:hypothetical protein
MFQTLGLVVNLIPFHTEDLGQHSLDQVMPKDGALGSLLTCRRELNAAVAPNNDQTVFLQPLQCGRYRRSCD